MIELRTDAAVAGSALCMALLCCLLLDIFGTTAGAVQPIHPLAPPDTSSPRATLKTFLDNMNEAVVAFRAGNQQEALDKTRRAALCLDLGKEPPALKDVLGFYTTLYLKEILDRIDIPPESEIPDAKSVRTEKLTSWVIPYTEIALAAVKDDNETQRFLFSCDTVRHAEQYYNTVVNLPCKPGSGEGTFLNQLKRSGSQVFPKQFLDRLPAWFRTEIYGQQVWQWIGLMLYCCLAVGLILSLYRWGDQVFGWLDTRISTKFEHVAGGLALPLALIVASKMGVWFLIHGLRILDADIYTPIAFIFLIIAYMGSIWLIGAALNRIAWLFVSVGGFVRGGMDDQLIRLCFQVLTVIIVGLMVLNLGARLGLPTYSLVTGLGIGGLAVALAGREALSNIIGTIMIVLDRPFKLGDYIILQDGERGEVTQVGLRSTRIRTRDDIMISIPNSVIANAKMINESAPVSMSRIRIKLGVAYGSDMSKVLKALVSIAEANTMVLPDPSPRVRFRSFGDSALNLELLCWIDLPEQRGLTIHQLNLAIKEEFEKQGIQMPFPQREVYIHTST